VIVLASLKVSGDITTNRVKEGRISKISPYLVHLHPYPEALDERFHHQPQAIEMSMSKIRSWNRLRRETYQKVEQVQPGDQCYVDLRAWEVIF
jgi:hypothetical protein